MIITGGKNMVLFRKTKNNIEKMNNKCEVCGKTFKNIISHKNKHLCEECYSEIFNHSNDKK